MAEQVSIWRWRVSEDLEALFARLIAADDDGFGAIARQISQEDAPRDVDQVFADAEAKVRAMGLPEEALATTLAGLKAMQEEAAAEQDQEEADFAADAEGHVGVALASSHMFFDDPYASLDYEEIQRQVTSAIEGYRGAIALAVGDPGQSIADYLKRAPEQLFEDATFDVLLESGLAEVQWLWVQGAHVLTLGQWQEDKELPIDLEFSRMPIGILEALRHKLGASHEM